VRASSILIVHAEKKTQRVLARVLGATGFPVDVADDLGAAAAIVAERGPALVVVDAAAGLSSAAEAFFTECKARGAVACMTLLGEDGVQHAPKLLQMGAVTNLLSHPMPMLGEELIVTAQKLLRNDLFGAEKYLLWGTTIHEHVITRSSDRPPLVAQLAEAVKRAGQSNRIASMAMLAADELISNAVHNAPVDEHGTHYRADVARDVDFALEGRHAVTLRWGCDARYLAVEVTDRFGSLESETIVEALRRSEVRESGGGAGMGIALTYRSCDHIVFNLSPGARTEIIALVDVRYPPSERMLASSYNVFVERT
jgi:DNA-binding response OmpR family regulator